jgi:hypothetical protein
VGDYPLLRNQRGDRYNLIASSKKVGNIYLTYGISGFSLDHFRSAGWEGIVAEIGRVNQVKFADVVQFNGLTVYRVGYEVPGGYREDAYIEGKRNLIEVCFFVTDGPDAVKRA